MTIKQIRGSKLQHNSSTPKSMRRNILIDKLFGTDKVAKCTYTNIHYVEIVSSPNLETQDNGSVDQDDQIGELK